MDTSTKPTQLHFLDQVERLIDWGAMAPQMQSISTRIGGSLPLAAVKMLLLSRWYGLGESALCEACADRISFRRFLGLRDADGADVMDAYRSIAGGIPAEEQDIVNVVEAQLAAKGVGVKAGARGEPALVEIARENAKDNARVSDTALFQPGEIGRLLKQAEPLLARAGAQMHEKPPSATGPGKPQLRAQPAKSVCAMIEWPWGAVTELKEHFYVGREFGFCPFARELQPYGHISRKHAELLVQGQSIWVRDLGSSNGTFVDDEAVPKGQAHLIDADARIRFGPNFVILLRLKQ